jgi:hypothetical protein
MPVKTLKEGSAFSEASFSEFDMSFIPVCEFRQFQCELLTTQQIQCRSPEFGDDEIPIVSFARFFDDIRPNPIFEIVGLMNSVIKPNGHVAETQHYDLQWRIWFSNSILCWNTRVSIGLMGRFNR